MANISRVGVEAIRDPFVASEAADVEDLVWARQEKRLVYMLYLLFFNCGVGLWREADMSSPGEEEGLKEEASLPSEERRSKASSLEGEERRVCSRHRSFGEQSVKPRGLSWRRKWCWPWSSWIQWATWGGWPGTWFCLAVTCTAGF